MLCISGSASAQNDVYYSVGTNPGDLKTGAPTQPRAGVTPRQELVFVDAGAPNDHQLINDLMKARAEGRPIEVVVLESGRDGVEQITEAMAGRRDVSAVHIVSHGSDGNLTLGNGKLSAYNIENYRDAIKSWQASMTDDADLLIYGCDVAGSAQGREMVDTLAALTGADVTASTDRTGNETLGGDWELEYEAGDIEAQIAFSSELRQTWHGLLAVRTFQQGDGNGYSDSQDTYVRGADPNTVFGDGDLNINFDDTSNGFPEHGLLRFDNIFGGGATQIPPGSTINSAEIRFFYCNGNGGLPVWFHRMLETWDETTATWNSMSTSGGGIQADDTEAVASADAIPAGPTTGTGFWTATGLASSLQAWSDGATNHGWVIFTGDNSVCLRSKADSDLADRPLLTVDYSPGNSAPTIAKAFSPGTIASGGTSTTTFTLTNPNGVLLTGANFTDTYPATMVNTTGLVVGGTCANITHTSVAGGSTFNLTGADIPASGSCTVTVDVTSSTPGAHLNTTSVLGTNEAPNSAAGGSDTLTVTFAPPTIAKAFAPSSIASGGTSTLTFTLTNPNGGLLTGASFTDTYPAGMVNTTGLVVGGTCANVTHTAVAGGSTFNLTDADIPASGSCTVTVDVTATATGVNTTSVLGTNEAPNSAAGGSDTLTVTGPSAPTIAKAFAPSTIPNGGTSTITFTLTNSNGTLLTGANFTDTYPATMVNTTGLVVGGTCANVTHTAVAGGSTFNLTAGDVPASGSCTVTVDVTSSTTGANLNTTSVLGTNEAPNSAAGGSDTLTVNPPGCDFNQLDDFVGLPNLGQTPFGNWSSVDNTPDGLNAWCSNSLGTASAGTGPSAGNPDPYVYLESSASGQSPPCGQSITLGSDNYLESNVLDASTYGFTFDFDWNMNGTAMDTGPASLHVDAFNGATWDLDVSGGAINTGNNGDVWVPQSAIDLTSYSNADFKIRLRYVVSTGGSVFQNDVAVDNLHICGTLPPAPPTIAKVFAPDPIVAGGTSTITFTLTNPDAGLLTGANFTDTYPAGMVNTTGLVVGGTCANVTHTAVAGGSTFNLTAGDIPASGSCTVTVDVTSSTPGAHLNTTSVLGTNEASNSAAGGSDTLNVNFAAPTIAKVFAPDPITAGGTSTITFTLTNPDAGLLTGANFTDTYPATVVNTTGLVVGGTCANVTHTAVAGGSTFNLTAGDVPASGSCTVTVDVTSSTPGAHLNTTSVLGTNEAPNSAAGGSDTLNVNFAAPTIAKVFAPSTITAGGTSTITFTLTNPNATLLTVASFTDTYPATMVNTTGLVVGGTCANVTHTAVAGGSTFNLTAGDVPASGSCTVTVDVTATATGVNTTSVLGTNEAPNSAAGGSDTLTVTVASCNAMMIVDDAVSPSASDLAIAAYLASNGVAISYADDNDTIATYNSIIATNSITTTYISESSASATLGTKAQGLTIGVVTANNGSWTNMLLGSPQLASSLGTDINVVDNSHFITSPFATGVLTIYTGGGGRGFTQNPGSGGQVLAQNPADATRSMILTYDTGSLLEDASPAPARRVGLFTDEEFSLWNGSAQTLMLRSTQWAGGCAGTAPSPSITKVFAPDPIVAGGTSTITFTLTNPNATLLTGANFTDTYPAGMVNTTGLVVGGTCANVTHTAVAGGSTFNLTAGDIPASGSCTVTVDVTSSTPGAHLNTTSVLGTNEASNSAAGGSDTLNVNFAAPTIAKVFAPDPITAGGTSTITFTLTNPNATLLTVASFTDTYPATVVNTIGLVVGGTCANVTHTAVAGGSTFNLTAGDVPASGSCTVTVDVTSSTPGAHLNTTSVLGTNEAPNSAAGGSDTLNVNFAAPTIAKVFAPSTITAGGTSTITFTLTNPNATLLTVASFTDTYPATMVNTTGLVVGGTCANVTHTAVAGGSTFNLTAGDVPASGSCTVTVDVTATATGVNTTSVLGTNEAPNSAAGGSDTLTVLPPGSTPNYRSIGTAVDYSTNTVTTTNGSPVVTGDTTLWFANNRGRGDRINIDGTNYTILSVDSETQLTLTDNFSGADGPGLTYNISRKFTTLQFWEDCISFDTVAAADVMLSDGWNTGLGAYTVPAGTDRLLVFATDYEDNVSTYPIITDVTFGGVSMTRAVQAQVASVGTANNSEIWYLRDAVIPAGSNSFVVVYDVSPDEAELHAYALFTKVDQVSPILDFDSATTTSGDVVGPTPAFTVAQGGMSVATAASGQDGNFSDASWGAGWVEGADQIDGIPAMTMGTANTSSAYGAAGTDTATATYVSGANRQVIVAASLNPTPGLCEGVSSADYLADNRREIGIAYKDSAFTSAGAVPIVQFDGTTTDASHDITLTADGVNRHFGIVGDGVVLDMLAETGSDGVRIRDEFITVEWLEITGGDGMDGFELGGLVSPSQVTLRYNLIHDTASGDGMQLRDADLTVDVYNNIIFGVNKGIEINVAVPTSARILNNTIYDSDEGVFATDGVGCPGCKFDTVLLQNNIAHTFSGVAAYSVPSTSSTGFATDASSNNLASDATGTTHSAAGGGINSVLYASMNFVSATDLHITSGSAAEDQAVDLSSIFTIDIDAGARSVPWDIGADDILATTAVELLSFEAWPADSAVELRWETGSELDNLGFHLYRSLSGSEPWIRITAAVIPGLGSSPEGASYSFRDTGLTNETTYFYRLEDIDTWSVSTFHGPVSATPSASAPREDSDDDAPEDDSDEVDEDPGSGTQAYGAPGEPSLRVLSRTARSVVLELTTPGFVATSTPAGVRVSVPGFDERRQRRAPALPLKRALLDAVVGRHARIVWAKEKDVLSFPGLTPAAVGTPEVFVRRDGTIRPRRKGKSLKTSRNGLLPRSAVRIAGDAFIGEAKKLALEMSPIRYDTASGELLLAQTLRVKIAFDRKAHTKETGKGSRGRRRPRSARKNGTAVLAHLHTLSAGLHGVSFEALSLSEPIPLDSLRLSLLGEPVPLHVEPSGDFGPGSQLFFHATSVPSSMDFSSETTYALKRATGGLQMERISSRLKGLPRLSLAPLAQKSFETNRHYQAGLLNAPDIWLWDFLIGGMSKSVPFSIQGLDSSSSQPAHIQVVFQGASEDDVPGEHHLSVSLNGTPLGETSFDGKLAHVFETSFPASLLLEGQNSLTLTNLGDTGAYSFVFLDRVDLVHPQTQQMRAGLFEGSFSEEGKALVSGEASFAVDVTEPGAPLWLASLKTRRGTVRFKTDAGHRYVLASAEGLLSPRISKPVRAKLRSQKNQADYVVIAPQAFLPTAQPLLERRQDQGLTTKAVSFEQITSQFGHGRPSAQAIRDFLAHAFHNWQTPSVKYVLLLGDASYDPRNFTGRDNGAPLPAFWAKTSYLWTSSDPTLAAVNGEDGLPDLAIGRLPATTVEEAHTLVQKVLAWEDSAQDLGGRAILVADNPDIAGDFEADIADIRASVLGGRETQSILLRQHGANTRSEVLGALDQGASILSYVGHGGPAVWASENVLNSWDPPKLLAQSEQPLMLTFNCLNGYFVAPNYDSLAEAFMKAEGRGTIGAFSPSGLSVDGPAHRFHKALLAEIVSGQHERLGDAVLAAQAVYAETGIMPELLAVYHLFADPAMTIR